MRRKDLEVTDPAQITRIMSQCQVLRIAIHDEPAPYILPVNFGMEPDGMTLYIHGAREGTKYRLLERDNRVSFEMDCATELVLNQEDHECSMVYESVIGWGYAEELTEENAKRHALRMLMRQYHAEDFPFHDGPLPRTRIFQIRIQNRTAKSRLMR